MQFKGALRSPGDRGAGVRVTLVVDEFHLEILRDHELIGRWYLADVEVVRDIAERFVLFLDDEEMEFLADDALQFAYDGVTAMQNAWLRAQKKKRRHRRAAADAARRKDESPAPATRDVEPAPEPVRASRQTRPAATSELARRLAASTPAASPAGKASDPGKRVRPRTEPEPAPEPEPAGTGRQSLAARRKKIAAEAAEPAEAPLEAARPQRKRREPSTESAAQPDAGGGPGALPPPWIAPEPAADEAVIASRRPAPRPSFTPDEGDGLDALPPFAPSPDEVRLSRRSRDAARAPAPEPIRPRGRGRRLSIDSNGASSPTVEEVLTEPESVDGAAEVDVRFAAEGHHPAETNTGLLSRLRRQPKRPDNHVHKFQESGSSVGLVRRVCVECSYVSIGSDDDSSSITRW